MPLFAMVSMSRKAGFVPAGLFVFLSLLLGAWWLGRSSSRPEAPPDTQARGPAFVGKDKAAVQSAVMPAGGGARLYPNVHALCVGINRYKATTVPMLRCAEQDADAVAKLFEDRFGYRVQRLTGSQATRAAILSYLRATAQRLGPDDALVVFFAGHGQTVELDSYGQAGFLVPFDAQVSLTDSHDLEQWKRETLDMRELSQQVEAVQARHVLVLVDACFSGMFGRRGALCGRKDLEQLVLQPSRMVITAGTDKQSAFEKAELGHGIFTHVLLEQLNCPAAISASEVFTSLRTRVAQLSGGSMLPQLRELVIHNGEFVFVPRAIQDAEVSSALQAASARLSEATAQRTQPGDLFAAALDCDYHFAVNAAAKEKEWRSRFQRFQDNAALGDPLAMAGLSYCYRRGFGTEKNPNQAYHWAKQAYDTDHPAGKHALATCYENGIGVAANSTSATRLLNAAMEQGFPLSTYRLAGTGRASGDGSSAGSSLDLLRQAGAAGVAEAYVVFVVKRRDQKASWAALDEDAWKLLQQAAADHCAMAHYFLYEWQSDPQAGRFDRDAAGKHLCAAAEAGYAGAQLRRGDEHYHKSTRLGWPQDDQAALRWYELAARQGKGDADSMLALMYLAGHGTAPNTTLAREHLEKGVKANSPAAAYNLGMCYRQGNLGYPRDKDQAERWFRQAARMDLSFARRLLEDEEDVQPVLDSLLYRAAELKDERAGDLLLLVLQWPKWYACRMIQKGGGDPFANANSRYFLNPLAFLADKYARDCERMAQRSQFQDWLRPVQHDADGWLRRAQRMEMGGLRVLHQQEHPRTVYFGEAPFAEVCYTRAAELGNAQAKNVLAGRAAWFRARAAQYDSLGMKAEAAWAREEASSGQ